MENLSKLYPQENFFFTSISILYRRYQVFINDEIEKFGLTSTELPYLIALLFKQDGYRQDELYKMIRINKAATSRALQSLEEKGMIERTICANNLKQRQVFLTAKAFEIRDDLFSIILKWGSLVFDGIDENDKKITIRTLKKMAYGPDAEIE